MGRKKKQEHFEENKSFPHFFQPDFEELKAGFELRGQWHNRFFKNNNPIVIEVGCGKVEYTVGLAQKYPDKNFIGIDRKGARMWRGAKDTQILKLKNVAFVRTRVELLDMVFNKGEVDEVWITFPDPQPKKRYYHKRLTSKRYIDLYSFLTNGKGSVRLKTDNTMFYQFSLDIVKEMKLELLKNTVNLYQTDPDDEVADIQTYYEQKYLEKGIPIKYLHFTLNKTTKLMKADKSENFFARVYEVVKLIPRGRATSYGSIAAFLGSKQSARMVGWAMNASHAAPDDIPAHRVVNRKGILTGKHHFGSAELMQQLLENEGVEIQNDQIVNFEKVFWDPTRELEV